MSTEPEHIVLDRYEAEIAVLVADDGGVIEVDRSQLPSGTKPGMVLQVTRDEAGELLWGDAHIDVEATAKRLEEAESILGALRKRDPGGDTVL